LDIASLIKYIVILVAVLGFLIILYVLPMRAKKAKEEKLSHSMPAEEIPSLNYLSSIINNSRTNSQQLSHALELIIKHHGKMPARIGSRSNPEIDIYKFLISRLCRHPNTNKTLIVEFTRNLEKLNTEYKKEINNALMEGLNSRSR